MYLRGKLVENIGPEDIESLIKDGYSEDKFLEYKSELPGMSEREKKEFLADVSAFANSEGGVIIYGVKTRKDADGQDTGIPQKKITGLKAINVDAEKLRLESILRDGLAPGLKNVAVQGVKIRNAQLLLIGIPKSLYQPHMIWFQRNGKFWRRSNSGKYQMDITELRQAFLESESWEQAADQFRQRRTEIVRKGKFLPNLRLRGSLFLHFVPLGGAREYLDLSVRQELLRRLAPPLVNGWNYRFNLDGYFIYGVWQKECVSYIQYFRRGPVEIYTSRLWVEYAKGSQVLSFSGNVVEEVVVKYTEHILNLFHELGVQPPIAVFLSVFDTMKSPIIHRGEWEGPDHNSIDRPQLLLPPAIFEEDATKVDQILRPILDMFWQAAGWTGSPNFADDGVWKGRKK